ncbi:protein Lines homolog 1 isoform X2 [Takifugu rubripes]|uniref:protein Lines homolog 1 isoform X2 n=1 Tax=Takifugu rubripes TaxID=31033 RepID=UPI001145570A|nr:protein Lines homolog 1 isoform X2 [Takifugu rubripes]
MEEAVLGCAAGPRGRFERLSQVYRCLQSGSRPGVSAAALASLLVEGACEASREDGGPAGSLELTGLSMTLLRKISSSLAARSLPPALASYLVETLKILVHEMDLMSHLVRHFQASDQILSHLAVRTVSTYVIYHLHESGAVSPAWEQTCLRAFALAVPGPELDACLRSLTRALKELVKGALQGDTGKLLSSFDSSLGVLCSKLLSEERATTGRSESTLCFLADLLEALAASSLTGGAGSCFHCQELVHRHSSELLKVISGSSGDLLKKRLLLLLKRAVLQKAGEEWVSGDLPGLKLKHFDPDVTLLAQSVVAAVGADWLEGLQVDICSSFWGSGPTRVDPSKPDCVLLRAVSLLLLKSMEIHIQTASRRGEKELCGYLQKLWGFLKRHSEELREEPHLCCWVGRLFGEQDDDMMEAAKALLSIFLHYRQHSGVDGLALLEEACASGYNPHCHFILLLESISFDHSFLLDLLISTETCFLEYFVQYLKCLLADWQGFAVTCGHVKNPPASSRARQMPRACGGQNQPCEVTARVPAHPPGLSSPLEPTSSAPGLPLVDYSSSDESDHENGGPRGATWTNRMSAPDVEQAPVRQPHFKAPRSGSEKTSDVSCEVAARVLGCVSELKEVVVRLHMKKLFPYNPAPLLKLLGQVQACCPPSR